MFRIMEQVGTINERYWNEKYWSCMRQNVIRSVGTRSRDLRVYLNWFYIKHQLGRFDRKISRYVSRQYRRWLPPKRWTVKLTSG